MCLANNHDKAVFDYANCYFILMLVCLYDPFTANLSYACVHTAQKTYT